jgi:nitrous oxidase accessory protein NosD
LTKKLAVSQEIFTKTPLKQKQPSIKQGLPLKNKTLIAAVFISMLLLSTFAETQFANLVSAQSELITIEADGSINPSTAPIAKAGNVYKMTDNITVSVTIERSNIIFDGDGYTIQSPGWSWALKLSPSTPIEPALRNITVKNVKVIEDPSAPNWAWGIMLDTTTNSIIANCTISNIRDSLGIWIQDFCTGNLIVGNNLTTVYRSAIAVWDRNNTITGNRIVACGNAIDFSSTSDNLIFGNHIENNRVGVHCFSQNSLPPGLENLIYCNNFVNNTMSFLNEAVFIGDTGVLLVLAISNVWDNGTQGNYWGDYNGTDSEGDGIGDTPYFIDDHYNLEGANDTDHYPLMSPVDTALFVASSSVSSSNPTPAPTVTATPTPSPSPNPTPTPFASEEPTASPSPSPEVPEMTLPAAVLALATATCIAVFAVRRKRSRPLASNSALQKSLNKEM